MDDLGSSNTSTNLVDSDLEKIRLEHKLSFKRMIFDRILFGVLVGFFGFLATLFVENFKGDLTETQFFLKERHEAATYFRKKFSIVSKHSIRQTDFACSLDPDLRIDDKSPFDEAILVAVDQLDSSSLLFSDEYLSQIELVLNIYSGAADDEVRVTCEHRLFFYRLADYTTYLTRQEVLVDSDNTWKDFVPEQISKEALVKMGSIDYLNLNFQKWVRLKQQNATRNKT